jgi:translation initiation factor IF-2
VAEVFREAGAFCFEVETEEIAVGQRVALFDGLDFHEEGVESLRVDDEDVAEARAGTYVGVASEHCGWIGKQANVYLVKRPDEV